MELTRTRQAALAPSVRLAEPVRPRGRDTGRTAALARRAAAGAALLAVTLSAVSSNAAEHRHHHRRSPRTAAAAPADAVELGLLAPPTRAETLEQTYGDAAIARANAQRTIRDGLAADRQLAAAGAPYPCDPPLPTATGAVCPFAPGVRGYGQGYAFTPSYVSAPTVVGRDPSAQTSLLSPFTRLFYGLNGAIVGRTP